ncbi:MAG: DUF4340 domain-containing protein [candidate division Zixibacteria bacterium]|nr:DUF4340 domain-containing protein [candidate division Zixibacteria bacterium]
MQETKKTIIYIIAAVVLAALAYITIPDRITSEAFLDQGELFFPDFTDPNTATTLEVMDFDKATATTRPFKVTFKDGIWTIPSHHNYPADAKDRLAKTAAGVIDIKKDDFRSDNVSDHEAFGVIDPLDETAGIAGKGTRITIKGKSDKVLADFIIGNEVEGHRGLRFVRVPGQNRVYASRVDIDLSTRFEDWIDTDLLQLQKHQIEKLVLKDYSIDERTRRVEHRDNFILSRDGKTWKANKMPGGSVVDSAGMEEMLTTLDKLTIVGVRPKPEGISVSLTANEKSQTISKSERMSLQSKGFYFSRDGQLLSNEGELEVSMKKGVSYTLRFGEIAYGSGETVTSGKANSVQEKTGPAENRYLFVTTGFDVNRLPDKKPAKDSSFMNKPDSLWTDKDRGNSAAYNAYETWKRQKKESEDFSKRLNARFAGWYYVISADSYEKLHMIRKVLVVKKKADEG